MSSQLLGLQREGEAAHTNSITMMLHVNFFFNHSSRIAYFILKVVLPKICLNQSTPLPMMAVATEISYWIDL